MKKCMVANKKFKKQVKNFKVIKIEYGSGRWTPKAGQPEGVDKL